MIQYTVNVYYSATKMKTVNVWQPSVVFRVTQNQTNSYISHFARHLAFISLAFGISFSI